MRIVDWDREPHKEIPFRTDMWYNRSAKAWVVQLKDKEGNQIGDAAYRYSKPEALDMVKLWREQYGLSE